MKEDSEEYGTRRLLKQFRKEESSPRKFNALLSDLLEKEEEIAVYKERLKELETAFCYNLQLISERDLELSILEEQLSSETAKLQQIIQEKHELEDMVKIVDDKSCRKIQHLQTRLCLKDEEIRELQKENLKNATTLKKILSDFKHQQEKQIIKLSNNLETQRKEMMKGHREEMEEKEKYYLLEIDSLTGKLEEICKANKKLVEAKEENKTLKCNIEDMKRLFREKENYYLEEMNRKEEEIRKRAEVQVDNREIQVAPDTATTDSQTGRNPIDSEEYYKTRINFLQEQNEVLKNVVKDLKKNRDMESKVESEAEKGAGGGKCSDCAAVKAEVEEVNNKFGKEIDDLKKIVHEEQRQRAEEEVVIQSLESSVTCLKDKLLSGLQEKLQDFAGDDICSYTYNREIQNEIKVSLLEQKLNKKMDMFASTAEEERQTLHEKLEELKRECVEKIEKYLKIKEEPTEIKSENLLEKIRYEIQKLENKIESDMKNMVKNNSENNKCDKNFQTGFEFSEKEILEPVCSRIISGTGDCDYQKLKDFPRIYCKNDIGPETSCLQVRGKPGQPRRKSVNRSFRKIPNDSGAAR